MSKSDSIQYFKKYVYPNSTNAEISQIINAVAAFEQKRKESVLAIGHDYEKRQAEKRERKIAESQNRERQPTKKVVGEKIQEVGLF